MNKRERMLAAAVGSLVVLFLLQMGWSRVGSLYSQRSAQLRQLQRTVGDRTIDVARGKMAAERLHAWQRQSLPADPDVAKSLYNDWLRQQLVEAKFNDVTIRDLSATGSRRRTAYKQLGFSVTARGSIEQLTEFLYKFYRANHLHQLRDLGITTSKDSQELGLTLKIEALILPGAERTDALNDGESDSLIEADLSSYTEAIVTRNLFAPYTEAPPATPDSDEAKEAVITAIVRDEGGWQAWVQIKTGKVLRLHEGDPFEVGSLSGTITRISRREVVFQADGRQRLAKPGKSLADAIELAEDDS